jgi:hypothetical protein
VTPIKKILGRRKAIFMPNFEVLPDGATPAPVDLGSPQAILAAIIEATTPPAPESSQRFIPYYPAAQEEAARAEGSFQ